MKEALDKIQDVGEGLAEAGWVVRIITSDLCKGCSDKTIQKDTGTNRILSFCSQNDFTCRWHVGQYLTIGETKPLNSTDIPIGENVEVGICSHTWNKLLLIPLVNLRRR